MKNLKKRTAAIIATVFTVTSLLGSLVMPTATAVAEDATELAPPAQLAVTDDFAEIADKIKDGTYTQDGAALKLAGNDLREYISKNGVKYAHVNQGNGCFRYRKGYDGNPYNLFVNWGEHIKISMENGSAFSVKDWIITRNEWSDGSSNTVTFKGYEYVDGTLENDVQICNKEVVMEKNSQLVEMNWANVDYITATVGQGVGISDAHYYIHKSDVLAYEGFSAEKDNAVAGVQLNGVKTQSWGWSSNWAGLSDGKYNFGIFSGSALNHAVGADKYVNRSPQYALMGQGYAYARRQFAVPTGDEYAAKYYTGTSAVPVENDINAFGKEGSTYYFSGLITAPVPDDDDRGITFERGTKIGMQSVGATNYLGNDNVSLGFYRGAPTYGKLALVYAHQKADEPTEYDLTSSITEYKLHEKQEATLFVVKYVFGANGTATVNLYLDPGTTEPAEPDATITTTTDVSFDRININANSSYKTGLDELKLTKTYEAAVETVDGVQDNTMAKSEEAPGNMMIAEESFESYENGSLLKDITVAANQVPGGGTGWATSSDMTNNTQNFTWGTSSNNSGVEWADKVVVTDQNPMTYPNLVTPKKYVKHDLTDTGVRTFGRMFDVSGTSIAETIGYVTSPSNGTKYLGTPGKALWVSFIFRMHSVGKYEGNAFTFDRGRWGFPWQADGPGLTVGTRLWGGDNKSYWTVSVGGNRVVTEKPIVADEDTLIVARFDTSEAIGGNAQVYINPDLTDLGEPDAEINSSTTPFIFRQLTVQTRDMDFGALRVGTTMETVLPMKSYMVPVTGVMATDNTDLTGAKIYGSNYGIDKGYTEITEDNTTAYKYIKIVGVEGGTDITADTSEIRLLANDRRIASDDLSDCQADSTTNTIQYVTDSSAKDQLEGPTALTAVGTFDKPQHKILKFNGPEGAKLYYTTDGENPSVGAANTTEYNNDIGIEIVPGDELNIKMKAVKENYRDSEVTTFDYVSPVDEFDSGLISNGNFEVKNNDGNIYDWGFWGMDANVDELVIKPNSGGFNNFTIDVAKYAGKTVEISAKVKYEGDYEADDATKNCMLKIHAKGDGDANFEPAQEEGSMFLLNSALEGLSSTEYKVLKQTVKLPETSDYDGFVNPFFRMEIWNNTSLTWHVDDVSVNLKAAIPAFSVEPIEDSTEELSIELTAEEGATIYYTTDGTDPTTESAVYGTEPIAVGFGEDVEIKAISVIEDYITSDIASGSYSVLPKLDSPVIQQGGAYSVKLGETYAVEITGPEGADIYYTTDGTEPTKDSMKYTEAVQLSAAETTVKAIAVADDYVNSDVASETFTISEKLDAPVIAQAGTYNVDFGKTYEVTITAQEGATIKYTLDGSDPTADSTTYTAAIQLGGGTTTIKAIAIMDGKVNSDVASAEFIVNVAAEVTPTPAATPGSTTAPGATTTPGPTNNTGTKKVTKVAFVKKAVSVKVGKKVTLKVKLAPKAGLKAAAKKVTWSIDKKGQKALKFIKKASKLKGKLAATVKGKKKGTAKVTCKAPSGKKAICKVKVKK